MLEVKNLSVAYGGLRALTDVTLSVAEGERGRGFAIGNVRVPLVCGASLFDLLNGGDKNWGRFAPYRDLGYAAAAGAAGAAGAAWGAGTARGVCGTGGAGGAGGAAAATRIAATAARAAMRCACAAATISARAACRDARASVCAATI